VVRLQEGPILADELVGAVRGDGDGAVALFLGTVRNRNQGREVLYLEYQAYAEMAESEMRRLEGEVLERFAISRVAVVHRTGRLEIGEASVGIAVAAPHREAALGACRFLIDALKRSVPIWKREVFRGGALWIEGPSGEPGG
jgi:molybdopterin synthase catalytic subunit